MKEFLKWHGGPIPKTNNPDWAFYYAQKEAWIAALKWALEQGDGHIIYETKIEEELENE